MMLRSIVPLALLLAAGCSKTEGRAVPSSASPTEGRSSTSMPANAPNVPANAPNVPANAPNVPANAPNVPANAPNVPANAPNVTLTLVDGFRLSLDSLKGKVVAVVVCSAIGSPGCRREAQGLAQNFRALEEHHVTAIGIVPEDNAQYREAVARRDVPFDFAADVDGQARRSFGVSEHDADPTVVLIDRAGIIREVWRSADPDAHVRELLVAAER